MMRSADDAPWGKARVMFLYGGCVRITLGVYSRGPRKKYDRIVITETSHEEGRLRMI
jgi:hypothetical protein